MGQRTLIQSAWIAPMITPPIRDGGVVIDGPTILAAGPAAQLRADYPDASVFDAGDTLVLPGLVNAHTHLELSATHRPAPPERFVDWLIHLMSKPIDPAGMRIGIQQCLTFGVTTVGDITSQPASTRPVLAGSVLNGVSFGEVRAMGQRRGFLDPRIEAAIAPTHSNNIHPGISPHSPYSIEWEGYHRCLQSARQNRLPLTTHLAESLDENRFLEEQTGPFKDLWNHLNAWDQQVPRFTGGPIRFAREIGLLDYPSLLAHVNYCDDTELQLLTQGQASIVYCPRTHAYFRHPPHRWREMLKFGINVVIGTDSCSSSPDLNLVDDLRLAHQIAPEMEPVKLWEMITTRAAVALGLTNCGQLSAGVRADLAIFPCKTSDPLREVLETAVLPRYVWVNGRPV